MKNKKTWKEKLADSKNLPRIEKIPQKMAKKWGRGTLLIPAPLEVDELMKCVPKGKLITINNIRKRLAVKHGVTICCPITTGIFAWISANAAHEDASLGKKKITPYWRTLKTGGILNEKYPNGVQKIKSLLESEGHTVIKKGDKYIVENYENKLAII